MSSNKIQDHILPLQTKLNWLLQRFSACAEGADLGSSYKKGKDCVEYIAQEQRELLNSRLAKAQCLVIQLDGSTDAGK